MLNEVVKSNKHTCSAHTSTEEQQQKQHTITLFAADLIIISVLGTMLTEGNIIWLRVMTFSDELC